MGLKYRLETEIELKESAQEFYKMFKGQCLHIPKVTPAWVQDVKIHQGDWETHGSIRIWNYTADGKAEVFKERVEFDDENTTVTLVGLDGDFLKRYKEGLYDSHGQRLPFIQAISKKGKEMAGLVYKWETEIPLKEPADKFYKMFKEYCSHLPTACPVWIQDVKVHEGDWESHGSIRIWNYTVAGKAEVFKERVEFDDENNATTLVGVEGHVFETYKSYKSTYHFISDGSGGSKARLTLTYEKLKDDSPHPGVYLDLMVSITQDIENHLVKP